MSLAFYFENKEVLPRLFRKSLAVLGAEISGVWRQRFVLGVIHVVVKAPHVSFRLVGDSQFRPA